MIGNGLLRRAGALASTSLVMMTVAVLTATPAAHALQGGDSAFTAEALPCTVPCAFTADNTAAGLDTVTTDAGTFANATWYALVADASTSLTVRIEAAGWAPALVATDADTNVLAVSTDGDGRDAAITLSTTAGDVVLLALAGLDGTDQGTATMTLTTGTPDVPGDVGAAAFDASAGITWSAPDDHGDEVTEYRVYVNGSSTSTAVPAPATGTTITGLTVGATYTFEVSAVNAHGESARSTPTAELVPFTTSLTTVSFTPSNPSWPTTFSVVATVEASVTVSTGTVTFRRNGVVLGTSDVTNGVATLSNLSMAPGLYSYVANYSGAPNITASSAGGSVTVGKGTQTITFAGISSTAYSTGTVAIAPTSSSGLTVAVASTTTAVCTVRTGVVTLLTGGTCSLTATQAGNSSWLAAAPVVRSFAVVEEPQTITFGAPSDRAWSVDTFDVSASSTSGLSVSFGSATTEVCTVADGEVTLHRTGTCTLSAVQGGDARWAAAEVQRSFTVSPATPAALVTGVSADQLVEGEHAVLSWSGGSGEGAVTFELVDGNGSCTLDGADLAAIAEGTCTVRATQDGDTQYTAGVGSEVVVTVLAPPPTTTTSTTTTSTTTTEPATTSTSTTSTSTTTTTSTTTSTTTTSTTTTAPPPAPRAAMLTTFGAVHAVDTHPTASHLLPAPDRRLRANEVLAMQITGLAGRVPASGVGAVAVVVTVDGATASGHLTAYPCGVRPTASMLNVTAGRTVSSAAMVPVDAVTGRVCVVVSTAAHVAVDVTGWTARSGGHHAVGPVRVIDTRPGTRAARDVPRRPLTPGAPLRVLVTGISGVTPSDGVAAVLVHVTTVNAAGPGHLTIWACGAVPRTSTLNFNGPTAVANFAVVAVAADTGEVCVQSTRATHVVVDLTGWVASGQGYTPTDARRVVDTRPTSTAPAPLRGRLEPNRTVQVRIADLDGVVPASQARAVAVNVTVVGGTRAGTVRLGACDAGGASTSVAFAAGQTVAGGAIVRIAAGDERWCISTTAAAHVVIDVSGWFDGGIPG